MIASPNALAKVVEAFATHGALIEAPPITAHAEAAAKMIEPRDLGAERAVDAIASGPSLAQLR